MEKSNIKHVCLSVLITLSAFLIHSVAIAADKVVIVPLGKRSTGNAVAEDVRVGKTFSNADECGIAGTMPTQILNETTPVVFEGYYELGSLLSIDEDLRSENIKQGINIFGIPGSYAGRICFLAVLESCREWCEETYSDWQCGVPPVSCAQYSACYNGCSQMSGALESQCGL